MKKITVSEINGRIDSNPGGFIEESDKEYKNKLKKVADAIAEESMEKPIILLAGPSGSGKTTSAYKLDELLEKKGLKTHTISMDDYFLPHTAFTEQIMRDGKINYESPYRIDIGKLNEDMIKMSECKEIVQPKFNFASQTVSDGITYKREKGEIVVIEGIHALNPLVTGSADDYASCMYVSVRTRVELADGSLVHPSFIRLMRRLIRDKNFRGRAAADTLDMFDSVERGENKYILPFKHRAVYSVDTFLPYEPSVYKPWLIEELEHTEDTYPEFSKFVPVLRALREIRPAAEKYVGADSLVREFIGNSKYKY